MKRKDQKSLMVWLPIDIHEDFKKSCASNGIDMSHMLRMLIYEVVGDYRERTPVKYEQF